LATAGVVSLVVPIATGAIDAAALSEGQAQTSALPAFEAVSIKRRRAAKTGRTDTGWLQGRQRPDIPRHRRGVLDAILRPD
jgi:hypothetical protein